MPPVAPMLAKSVEGAARPVRGYLYEPKWDGFRCIVFRDGDEVELGSRNERPLTRYFPEVVDGGQGQLPERCVVDGEIVVAARRPARLRGAAAAHPPGRVAGPSCWPSRRRRRFVAFDLLALGDESLLETPLRRAPGAGWTRRWPATEPPVHLTPVTDDADDRAGAGSTRFEGAGLDGVVAKPRRPAVRAGQAG